MHVGQHRHTQISPNPGQNFQPFLEPRSAKRFAGSAIGFVVAGLENISNTQFFAQFPQGRRHLKTEPLAFDDAWTGNEGEAPPRRQSFPKFFRGISHTKLLASAPAEAKLLSPSLLSLPDCCPSVVERRFPSIAKLNKCLENQVEAELLIADFFVMPNQTTESAKPVKRRSWRRRLLTLFVGLVVLLFILYLVATSAAFLKSAVLPRVSKALNAEITVGDASLSPFSRVVLRQLTVKTTGAEPLLKANEVRLRYSLWSILGGNIKVDEVTLDSPAIQIVQNADGTSNLDPLLKREAQPAAQPPAGPSKPLRLDVRNVALKNVRLRAVQNSKDGARQTMELSDINIGLDQLKNGAAGKLTLAAAMKIDRTQTNAHDSLQAQGSGALEFALGADLLPQFVRGKVTHQILKGDGSFSGVAGERTELNC